MNITRKLKTQIRADIMEWIDFDGYDFAEPKSDADKIAKLLEVYEDEYGTKPLHEWLAGLPSCIDLPFTYADIIEVGVEWLGPLTEDEEDELCDAWFKVIATELRAINKSLNGN